LHPHQDERIRHRRDQDVTHDPELILGIEDGTLLGLEVGPEAAEAHQRYG
jgi:hypothetical protein